MASSLSGTIVVVGASSGIGEALAMRLAHEARSVALLARRADRLRDVCARINDKVGTTRAHPYPHDVGQFAEAATLLDRIEQDLGEVDELHFVAGVMPAVGIDEYPTEHDEAMVRINMIGCMAWCNAVAPRMQRRGRGHIVGVTSVAGMRGRRDRPGYNASKAGQDVYLEAIRNRLWRHGVRVTTVRPGPVLTPMTEGIPTQMPITAERCVDIILRARNAGRAVVFAPWKWRPIMRVIREIPSFLFRRMNV